MKLVTEAHRKTRLDQLFVKFAESVGLDPIAHYRERAFMFSTPDFRYLFREGLWPGFTAKADVTALMVKEGRYWVIRVTCNWGSTTWTPEQAFVQARVCMRASETALLWQAISEPYGYTEAEMARAVEALQALGAPLPDESE